MVIDPVCGAQVDEMNPPEREMYEGHEYFFDKKECKDKFNHRPDLYSGHGLSPNIEYPSDVPDEKSELIV